MTGDERKRFGKVVYTLEDEGSILVVIGCAGVMWSVRWPHSWLVGAELYALSLTEYIQPVCLPAAGQGLVDGKVCTVTGWGTTQFYVEF